MSDLSLIHGHTHYNDYIYEHHDSQELNQALKNLLQTDKPSAQHISPPLATMEAKHHQGLPPGISELDDVPGGILVAKPAFMELQHANSKNSDHESRLNHFQNHETSHTSADLAANLSLDAAMGLGGGAALVGGIMDFLNAHHRKNNLLQKKNNLEEKKQAFSTFLTSNHCIHLSESSAERQGMLHKKALIEKSLVALEWELKKINLSLGQCDQHKQVGVGSSIAGLISVVRAVVGLIGKPFTYTHPATVEATGTLLSSVSIVLSPLGGLAALYMGIKARRLSEAQRKEFKENLRAVMHELGIIENKLPADIQDHYKRCFVNGKYQSRDEQTKSFNQLLGWFVRAMKGYTTVTTGVSIAKIVAVIIAGAIAADVTLSTLVLASALAVLYGVYGFLRHQTKIHQYEKWAESFDPGFARDFMLSLATTGDLNGLIQPLKLSMLTQRKRDRRQDFIHSISTNGRKKLPILLQSPSEYSRIVNYMQADLEDDLRYLDDEIQQQIKMFHLPCSTWAQPPSSTENKKGVINEPIDEHFHTIGLKLLNDKRRYQEMLSLHEQLLKWKQAPLNHFNHMAKLQSRFLSIQLRQLHNPVLTPPEIAAQQLAKDLRKEGKKRDKATQGRLEVFTLDTASLRQSSATLHALPMLNIHVPEWDAYLIHHQQPS
jgi:hypothetical protein